MAISEPPRNIPGLLDKVIAFSDLIEFGGLGGELLFPKYSGWFRYRHIADEVKPPQKQEFKGVVILLRKFAKKKVPSLNVILVLLPPYAMWRYPNPPEISQDFWKK